MTEPITSAADAVREMGALPVPVGPERPTMTPERLSEIRDLLRYESSIAFYSHRAKESMLLLVAEAEEAARLRTRVAELEAPTTAQQRKGYEAAIEVMRQEKLPMSVGLLEAQLELNKLDGLVPALTVFRASHDSIVMGHYTTAAEARKHCETVYRNEHAESTKVSLWWRDDEGEEDPTDREVELISHVTPRGFDRGRTWYTGYRVTPVEISSEYDEEADA